LSKVNTNIQTTSKIQQIDIVILLSLHICMLIAIEPSTENGKWVM